MLASLTYPHDCIPNYPQLWEATHFISSSFAFELEWYSTAWKYRPTAPRRNLAFAERFCREFTAVGRKPQPHPGRTWPNAAACRSEENNIVTNCYCQIVVFSIITLYQDLKTENCMHKKWSGIWNADQCFSVSCEQPKTTTFLGIHQHQRHVSLTFVRGCGSSSSDPTLTSNPPTVGSGGAT